MIKRLTLIALAGLLPLSWGYAATTESLSDDAMERAAEKLITEGASPKSARLSEKPVENAAAASEDETPVALAEAPAPKSGGSMIWRLLASVAVLAVAGLGLHFFVRRYSRAKTVGGTQSRIEMMHQYHLGPRKSLALVRVAGETVLVGITDHNINLLKTVTLIDDDMAAAMNQDFNGFLEDEYAVTDVNHIGRRNQ